MWPLSLLLLAAGAQARPLTLDEALATAAAANRTVVAAGWAEREAEGRVDVARSAWSPVLSASSSTGSTSSAGFVAGYPLSSATTTTQSGVGLDVSAASGTTLSLDASLRHDVSTTTSSLGGVESVQEQSNWQGGASVSVTQDLLAPLRTQPSAITVRQAREAGSAATLARERTVNDTLLAVADAWWTCWSANDAVVAAGERLGVARALEGTSRARFEEGALASLEVDRATADRLAVERDLLVARTQARRAGDDLLILLGEPPGGSVEAVGDGASSAALVDEGALWDLVSQTSPALLAARAERDAAAAALRDARDAGLPKLDLLASLGTSSLQDQARTAVSALAGSEGLPQVSVGLALSAPLSSRASRGERGAAEAVLAAAEARLAEQEDTLRAEVRSAVADLEAARQGVELAALRARVARSTEDGEQARVDEGTSRLDQLLEARRVRVDAETDLRAATAAVGRARIALDALRGAVGVDRG